MKNAGQLLDLTIVETKTKERNYQNWAGSIQLLTTLWPVMIGLLSLGCNHNSISKGSHEWWPSFSTKAPLGLDFPNEFLVPPITFWNTRIMPNYNCIQGDQELTGTPVLFHLNPPGLTVFLPLFWNIPWSLDARVAFRRSLCDWAPQLCNSIDCGFLRSALSAAKRSFLEGRWDNTYVWELRQIFRVKLGFILV